METKKYSGQELVKALQEGAFQRPTPEIVGMVKTSEKEDHIAVSLQGCENWLDIPTDMIDNAEQIGWQPCHDRGHPLMRIRLKGATTPEAKIFSALLEQAHPTRSQSTPAPVRNPGEFYSAQLFPPPVQQPTNPYFQSLGFGSRNVASQFINPRGIKIQDCVQQYAEDLANCIASGIFGDTDIGYCQCLAWNTYCNCVRAAGGFCLPKTCPTP